MNPLQREILVIDGDEGSRDLMGQILAEQGFAVTAVGDGSTALRRIEAKPFALVVAEIRLPGALEYGRRERGNLGSNACSPLGSRPRPCRTMSNSRISSPSRFTDGTSSAACSSCCSATQLWAGLSLRISSTATHRPG